MRFVNISGHQTDLKGVVQNFHDFVTEHADSEFRLIVGTDSQVYRKKIVFVTVIAIHRVGHGARFYFHRRYEPPRKKNIYERLMQETADSIEVVRMIEESSLLKRVGGLDNLEVHVDAGMKGRSSDVIDACVGYVSGMGYNAKTKPYASVASHAADKLAKA